MGAAWWWLIGLLALVSVLWRHNLLFLMSLLLALIGGASLLWTRTCLASVSYRRRFGTTRLFYGEETDLYVEIVNAKPLPLAWLSADDEFPADVELLTGQLGYSYRPRRRRLVNLLSLRWYERVTRRYRLRGSQRGAWQFGPVELVSGDLFGFNTRQTILPETQLLLVYPRLVPLTALGLPAHHPFGDFKTVRRIIDDPIQLRGPGNMRPATVSGTSTGKPRPTDKLCKPGCLNPRPTVPWPSSSTSIPLSIFMKGWTPFSRSWPSPRLPLLPVTLGKSSIRWGCT